MNNNLQIRLASDADLQEIMEIFDISRKFMAANGNPNQWINGYPSEEIILKEIEQEHCYVCETSNGTIVGTFSLIKGEEKTYNIIYNGSWLNDEPYATIHRLASNGKAKGIAEFCFTWCFNEISNIRIDTHEDNKIMQHIIEKNGFVKCGTIKVENGSSRIAYQHA